MPPNDVSIAGNSTKLEQLANVVLKIVPAEKSIEAGKDVSPVQFLHVSVNLVTPVVSIAGKDVSPEHPFQHADKLVTNGIEIKGKDVNPEHP